MCRVLVLDDNLEIALSIKALMENRSTNTVDAVSTSRDAAALVTKSIQDGKPYEVFLIDHQLENSENGIEVMQSLKRLSPDTEAIIFTGYGDVGMEAYRAGAFRYLAKPFDNQELLYLIDAVREYRRTRQEHGWQKIFSEFMEAALQQQHFHDTAEVVVKYSLRLGFRRAHLFWVPTGKDLNKDSQLIGIACAGRNHIQEFKNHLLPVQEWFDLDLSDESNAMFIRTIQKEIHPGSKDLQGYRPPVFAAAILPIRQANILKGLLLLDFDQVKQTLSEHERSLLNLFSRQVSVVLNQASLHGREQWLLQESALIQKIGRQINAKAASANLIDLLEETRRQIGELIDVSNFSIFLHNEENNRLDFHLLYENDLRRKGISRPLDHGFEEYLLASQKEVLLSHTDLEQFIQDQEISFKEPLPVSLMGVPLRVENKTIGGIVVRQNIFQGREYLENDKRILLSVADQVAGAIQISRLAEAEKMDIRRMQVLQKANTEMLRIAHENLDHFWLTLLTIATSSFGLGFNRALLFLEQENFRKLCGRMGVGTDDTEEARRDWERDEQRVYDFEDFLEDLGTKKRRQTPFEALIHQVEIENIDGSDAVSQVLREKTRVIVEESEVQNKLPVEITRAFALTRCAILPLRAADRVMGVVIVDNKHNHEILQERSLERLQSLLDNAGLVYETFLEQEKSNSLLRANYEILGGATDQVLRETLSRICLTAHTFTGADWVIILPLLKGEPRQFDIKNIAYAGTLRNPLADVIGPGANFGGISQSVLKRGILVVHNIEEDNPVTRRLNLSSHHFIRDEGVKALIGGIVRSQEDEQPLGLLYLDYRQPQSFSDLEIQQAVSFASLAGVAISNARRMDELQQRTDFKTAKEIAETVGTGLSLETTLGASMQILHKVFENTRMCVLLYLKDINALKFAPGTLTYYKIPTMAYRKQDAFSLDEKSIACRVAKEALLTGNVIYQNVGDVKSDPDYLPLDLKTKSELCISLMGTKDELLGVLVMESYSIQGLDHVDVDLVKTVAQQLSSAIEFAQQSEELQFRTTVAARTSWAADIAHEINKEVGQIRNWASILMDRLQDSPKLQELVQKIEESASVLSHTGPWSDSPTQVVKLDLALKRNVKSLTDHRDLPIDFRLNAEDVYIRVNPVYFERVLRHLIRNASRAMINSKVRKIIITTHTIHEKTVEILFQDTGPGISEEIQLSIFQRPVTTKSKGGFGLLLVRQMIEDMGGQIRYIQQKKGQGARFSILFPIASIMEGIVE